MLLLVIYDVLLSTATVRIIYLELQNEGIERYRNRNSSLDSERKNDLPSSALLAREKDARPAYSDSCDIGIRLSNIFTLRHHNARYVIAKGVYEEEKTVRNGEVL